jgi:hypothetical protein
MRFMILRKADKKTEAGGMPSEELLAKMGQYAEEMMKAGVLLGGEGLQPTAKGARVRFAGGNCTVMDGPFTESKELLAGYFMIKVASKRDAIEWVKRWPPLDGDVELEIRQVFEPEDFGPSPTIDREIELRKQLEKKK